MSKITKKKQGAPQDFARIPGTPSEHTKAPPEEARKGCSQPQVCPTEEQELGLWEVMKSISPSFMFFWTKLSSPVKPPRFPPQTPSLPHSSYRAHRQTVPTRHLSARVPGMLCLDFITPPCLPFDGFGCRPVWLQLSCPCSAGTAS